MFDAPEPEAIAQQLVVGMHQSGDTVKLGGRWYCLDMLAMLGFPLELRRASE